MVEEIYVSLKLTVSLIRACALLNVNHYLVMNGDMKVDGSSPTTTSAA